MAATATVLTFWQLLTRGAACQLPSVVLVNAGRMATDPIDLVIGRLAPTCRPETPRMGSLQPGRRFNSRKEASRAMLHAVAAQEKLDAASRRSGLRFEPLGSWEKAYQDARAASHGPGRISRYGQAWCGELGLITDPADAILLRLDNQGDREAFLRDLSGEPGKLQHPVGPGGAGLARVAKTLALSGSLAAGCWDGDLVDRTLALGLPVFFLPHATAAPLELSNLPILEIVGLLFEGSGKIPVHAYSRLPDHPFVRSCENDLWRRLPWLPHASRFALLQAVQQLEGACGEIVRHLAARTKTTEAETSVLMADLYLLALRGLTMSVAALAWHAVGFDAGCPLPEVRELLGKLRESGPWTRRDTQRKGRFSSAEERDGVLERLRAEGLVQAEGNMVNAVSLPDFIRTLDARPALAAPEPLWPGAMAAMQRKAS